MVSIQNFLLSIRYPGPCTELISTRVFTLFSFQQAGVRRAPSTAHVGYLNRSAWPTQCRYAA